MSEAKQRILDTASQLFAERGYELVGINELIEKSGVAKATFYQHFRSKEKLCAEWLRSAAAACGQGAKALLDSDLSPEQKVAMKFDRVRDNLQKSEFRGCAFSNTASMMTGDNEVSEIVREYKTGVRRFWHALALQMRGDPVSARALGDAFFLLYSGGVTEAQNSRALWPIESAKAAALALCGEPAFA